MIRCEDFFEIFKKEKLTFFTGVPDSTFEDWMKFLADGNEITNISAVNECEAAAICAGYYLSTGKIGVLYMQNSGLGKVVNPHTSLVSKDVYSIPVLYMIGWRGEPGVKDEPQHKMMGRIMLPLFDVLEIPYEILPDNINQAEEVIIRMKKIAEDNQAPVAIIIKKETFEEYVPYKTADLDYEMSREDAIKIIINNLDGSEAIVSTTGKTSRELFEYRREKGQGHDKDFLTVGSMGCSSTIGFGITMQTNKPIYIFDGDGAALMQMGSLATIGANKPKNLQHIIFDNSSYDSTGGQPTISPSIDFKQVALACGYNSARTVKTKEELEQAVKYLKTEKGPNLLVIKVRKGARKDLGRPTTAPIENKNNFMNFIKN